MNIYIEQEWNTVFLLILENMNSSFHKKVIL